MTVELITRQDLEQLKNELLAELRLNRSAHNDESFLKSGEVKDILKCSDSTLQKHRIAQRLPFSKIGGTYYYRLTDVEELLNSNRGYIN